MVRLTALILWCCGGKKEGEEEAAQRSSVQQPSMSAAESKGSVRGKDGLAMSPMPAGSASLDETSLSISVINLLEKDVDAAPKLIITTAEGNSVTNPVQMKINALGLEGSLRKKQDGITYIGSVLNDGNQVLNDFVIPEDSSSLGRRHLMIRFNPSSHKYYLKDLGEGSGTFVKIDIPILLKQGYIISFGESHMVTQFDQGPSQYCLHRESITLKFLDGPKVDQMFTYQPGEKQITIGRMAECNIRFDDNSLSRYQCSLYHVAGKGWMVTDGDGKKGSTNGTWLFVDDMFEIFNNMVFKAGQTLFQVNSTQARVVADFD
jgi:pSer/pThr/pTyr-binding forkhead associated (FHA) protein